MRHIVVFELQFLARGVRRVDDEDVGPRDQLLEDLLGTGRFQIERDAALVAVGEMPLIGLIRARLLRDPVPMPPGVAARIAR